MTQQLNTLPIEIFLEKARIARKSNQKSLNLSIDEVMMLEDSLAVVMTRIAGDLDSLIQSVQQSEDIVIKMDGGSL
jgi:hypothetical protein